MAPGLNRSTFPIAMPHVEDAVFNTLVRISNGSILPCVLYFFKGEIGTDEGECKWLQIVPHIPRRPNLVFQN